MQEAVGHKRKSVARALDNEPPRNAVDVVQLRHEGPKTKKQARDVRSLTCYFIVEPAIGLEPMTPALRERCSTN